MNSIICSSFSNISDVIKHITAMTLFLSIIGIPIAVFSPASIANCLRGKFPFEIILIHSGFLEDQTRPGSPAPDKNSKLSLSFLNLSIFLLLLNHALPYSRRVPSAEGIHDSP